MIGTLSADQTGVVNTVMYAQPITLDVTSPLDGTLVLTNSVTVTGNVQNADSVTVRTTNNGTSAEYPAEIINGAYSATIAIASGTTSIGISALNNYNASAYKSITVTHAPFTLRNLGGKGTLLIS